MKKVLILGGSSDIGVEVVKNFLGLNWAVVAHFSENKKNLQKLEKKHNNLKMFSKKKLMKIFILL